jgi:hypothetical protein
MADIDLTPTAEMAANATRGLELRKKHGKGGTAVGVARARDIKNRASLSPDTVRRMHSFFSRHEGNQAGGEDDAGYIAWLLWGGDAGKSWAKRKTEQLNDKQENARMERSDELAEALMKPVTYSNHRQMEKVVSAAIAHAKKVGDDDLLELAEETGQEILALRSRAARPDPKRMIGTPRDYMKAKLMPLTYQQLVKQWVKSTQKSAASAPPYTQDGRKQLIKEILEAHHGPSSFTRPGAKAKFAARLGSHPQKKKIIELLRTSDDVGDWDDKGVIVYDKSAIAAVKKMLEKNGIKPMVNVGLADDYSGGSYHSRAARPGAKAKFTLMDALRSITPIEKSISAARELLRNDSKQGNWSNCVGMSMSLSNLYMKMAKQYEAASRMAQMSRPGAKAKMGIEYSEESRNNIKKDLKGLAELAKAYRNKEAERLALRYLQSVLKPSATAQTWMEAEDAVHHIMDVMHGEYSRPGAKAKIRT